MELSNIYAIVLHFRFADQTLRCLRSIQAGRLEHVILVDNSEDGGKSLCSMRAQLEVLRTNGLRFQLLTPSKNLGFAAAVNLGLGRAVASRASGVLIVNSDAQLEAGALCAMTRIMDGAAVAMPWFRSRPNEAARSLFGYYQRAFALVLRSPGRGSVEYPSGCCLLLRSDVIRPDLFDEDFFFYGEDVALGHALKAQGIRVVECPAAVVTHAGSGSAKNGSMFYEYHINRGHWLLAAKLAASPLQRIIYIACRSVSLPFRATVRSLRFRSLVPWRGLVAATLDVVHGRCRSFTPSAP